MDNYIQNGVFCRKLVALLFWLWNFSSLGNLTFRSVSASSSINSSYVVPSSREPNVIGEARESNSVSSGFLRTTSNPNSPDLYDNEEFPLWVIVLIVVTGGLFMVACILCLIKLHRWKKDHGTYSMWNNQGPSVEAMFERESGVLFERLDIESSLAQAQCYEIPVDSFETPQRIYIDGIRVTPLAESLETPVSQRSLSQIEAEINIIDQTQYCLARDRTSVSTDVTGQESLPSSIGPDTSPRSSISMSTVSDKGPATPSQETPKELYPKPLPVLPVEDTPSVFCEIYTLDVNANDGRVSAIANRPLPQTPSISPPPVKYSAASLDRSLLRQIKEAKIEKPNTSRTLPRLRKIRQIPLPFRNAMSRSASSSDVSKEAERLSDHVASDPKKCTLTRVKKRLSQSVDTLIASERVSHFYENPYLVEGTDPGEGKGGDPSRNQLEPPYSRVSSIPTASDENLPKDKEHLYTRISQYMDGHENNLNRHSYASVHSSFRTKPKSRHVYISIIFGSADSVCIPSSDNSKTNPDPTKVERTLSRSCPSLNSSTQPHIKYNPRPNSYYPPTDTSDGLYSVDIRNARTQVPNGVTNDLMSFPDCRYQNIRESLGIPPLAKPVSQSSAGADPSNGYQNLQETMDTSQNSAEVYNTPKSLHVRPYYENITCIRDNTGLENKQDNGIDTSHYGVPKSPPIPLNRFCEIVKTTSNGKATSPQSADANVPSKGDGDLEIWRRKRDAENADERAKNGERATLSTYLEGRFNADEFHKVETNDDRTVESEMSSKTDQNNEPTYENFISANRDSCISEESASSHDRVSLASSLSIEDKEIYENQPLIPKTSDVNGNSVCEGFVEKLEVRRKSLVGSTLFEESVA